ncbi:MAG: lysophospholipase [Oscillospiraceae bacterium]|nr:lysophospholipase [Oscillospiraceae bacterium]
MKNINYIKVNAKDGAVIPVVTFNIEDAEKKGVVIISHGFGEHADSYIEFAEFLWKGNYASVIIDQRGHGKPPEGAKRWHGQIQDYECFVDDIVSVTAEVKKMAPDTPIALYGHSMGGNIIANTLLKIPPEQVKEYSCAILESPWFELTPPLSPTTRSLVRFLSKVMPKFRIHRKLNHEKISSDEVKNKTYSADPYYHGFISVRMLDGIMNACDYALGNAEKLPVKTYLAYASNEVIVSNKEMIEFAEKAGDIVTLKKYESNHAIHNDINQVPYCEDIIAFLDANLSK